METQDEEMVLIITRKEDGKLETKLYGDDLRHEYKTQLIQEVADDMKGTRKR